MANRTNVRQAKLEQVLVPRACTGVSTEIKIADEGSEKDSEFEKARQIIGEAAVVCFLGFGYHPKNIQRLGFEAPLPKLSNLFGSAYGFQDGERPSIESQFKGKHIQLGNHQHDVLTFLRQFTILF